MIFRSVDPFLHQHKASQEMFGDRQVTEIFTAFIADIFNASTVRPIVYSPSAYTAEWTTMVDGQGADVKYHACGPAQAAFKRLLDWLELLDRSKHASASLPADVVVLIQRDRFRGSLLASLELHLKLDEMVIDQLLELDLTSFIACTAMAFDGEPPADIAGLVN